MSLHTHPGPGDLLWRVGRPKVGDVAHIVRQHRYTGAAELYCGRVLPSLRLGPRPRIVCGTCLDAWNARDRRLRRQIEAARTARRRLEPGL